MQEYNIKSGFVALMSVIIISAILLILAVTLSSSSIFERYDILSSEMKEKSLSNAEACIDEALLILANDETHTSTTTTTLTSNDNCTIGPIPGAGNPRIFYVTSNRNGYTTNIKTSVNPLTISVNYWEEIPTY